MTEPTDEAKVDVSEWATEYRVVYTHNLGKRVWVSENYASLSEAEYLVASNEETGTLKSWTPVIQSRKVGPWE